MANVEMPQLGESVTEGTVIKWYKSPGDQVALDEPLFDVSTDKVDTEVPSPASGILEKILIEEGETVDVGTLLAIISDSTEGTVTTDSDTQSDKNSQNLTNLASDTLKLNIPVGGVEAVPPPPPPPKPVLNSEVSEFVTDIQSSDQKHITSPLVRNLLKQNEINLDEITATGFGNRVTIDDVKVAIQRRDNSDSTVSSHQEQRPFIKDNVVSVTKNGNLSPSPDSNVTEFIEFNNIRRLTAEHMVQSKRIAPHSTIVVEVDFEAVEHAKNNLSHKHSIGQDVHLTYLPFVAKATIEALKLFPKLNSSVVDNGLVVHRHINLGFGVDLNFEGLVVPVIHDADQFSVTGLASAIVDLSTRARGKKLSVDELVGGTFTISNPGPYHTLLTIPIINQPEVGILATDSIRRKPVVVNSGTEEFIGIHSVGLIGVTFDHRAVDGAYAAKFVATISEIISSHDWDSEI